MSIFVQVLPSPDLLPLREGAGGCDSRDRLRRSVSEATRWVPRSRLCLKLGVNLPLPSELRASRFHGLRPSRRRIIGVVSSADAISEPPIWAKPPRCRRTATASDGSSGAASPLPFPQALPSNHAHRRCRTEAFPLRGLGSGRAFQWRTNVAPQDLLNDLLLLGAPWGHMPRAEFPYQCW